MAGQWQWQQQQWNQGVRGCSRAAGGGRVIPRALQLFVKTLHNFLTFESFFVQCNARFGC